LADFQEIDQVHKIQHIATPIPENAATYEKLLPVFKKAAHCQARLGEMLAELDL